MKKTALFWVFLLQSYLFNAQSTAEYTVYYHFISTSDTISNTFFRPQEFMLYQVGQESRFIMDVDYYNDSVRAVFQKEYPQPVITSSEDIQKRLTLFRDKVKTKSGPLNYKISKNFETGNFISVYPFSLPTQYLEEPMPSEWEMLPEQDTILGFPCLKAATNYGGRHYFAWFTLEVPINDGPYVFQGLILKVTDDKGWYNFVATNIITKPTNRYWNPEFMNKFSQKIDRKTYVAKMLKQKNDPPPIPGIIDFSEADRLELKERYAKRFDLLLEQY